MRCNRVSVVFAIAAVAIVALLLTTTAAEAALVSYWSFDTDASDAMGAHDGTLVNGATITTGNQGFGGGEALSLAGGSGTSAQHVTTADPTTFDFNTDFTWHAHIKTSSGAGGVFGRAPATPTDHNQGSKCLFIQGSTVEWDTGWVGQPNTGVAVNDNAWHQVIATYVAATDRLDVFVDPTVGATTGNYGGTHNVNRYDEHTHVHNSGIAHTSFRIGQVSDNFENGAIIGLIDEAAVFDTALAGADLDQLITSGPSSFASGGGPVIIPVRNGSFELIYKPGSTTVNADLGGGWTTGVGPAVPMHDSQTASFSDGTTGTAVDIPGWIGAAGWDNSYDLNSNPNRRGSVARQTSTPDGLYYFLANGAGWGNQAGGVIASDAPLGTVEPNATYTLSMLAHGWGDGSGATPLVLDLLADGVALTPSSLVDPVLGGATWLEVSRTYDVASLAGSVGKALTIRLGVDRDASGNQTHFDRVWLTMLQADVIPEPATLSLLGLGALLALRRRRRRP